MIIGMATYASKTTVSPEKSRAEIERTLSRYGANAFSYGYDEDRAVVMFAAEGRKLRFEIARPDASAFRYTSPGGYEWASGARRRTPKQMEEAAAQDERQRWRALALVIKAKLEAVQVGIVTFEEEFLAHILLPSGETVGEWAAPQLEDVYEAGGMPEIMPGARLAITSGGEDA